MNKEMICKNCKYHYVEEISFDYPQSCCSKRMATTEEWCKCNGFEYGDRYVEQLQQENKQLQKELECTIGIVEHNRIISEKNKEIHQLKDNWKKLKEYMIDAEQIYKENDDVYVKDMREMGIRHAYKIILMKMQELEQGSDNDE